MTAMSTTAELRAAAHTASDQAAALRLLIAAARVDAVDSGAVAELAALEAAACRRGFVAEAALARVFASALLRDASEVLLAVRADLALLDHLELAAPSATDHGLATAMTALSAARGLLGLGRATEAAALTARGLDALLGRTSMRAPEPPLPSPATLAIELALADVEASQRTGAHDRARDGLAALVATAPPAWARAPLALLAHEVLGEPIPAEVIAAARAARGPDGDELRGALALRVDDADAAALLTAITDRGERIRARAAATRAARRGDLAAARAALGDGADHDDGAASLDAVLAATIAVAAGEPARAAAIAAPALVRARALGEVELAARLARVLAGATAASGRIAMARGWLREAMHHARVAGAAALRAELARDGVALDLAEQAS